MQTFSYVVKDSMGIHARPAGLLVKKAAAFACTIKICKGEKEVDAKRVIGVMSLGVKQNDTVILKFEGGDELEAKLALEAFMQEVL